MENRNREYITEGVEWGLKLFEEVELSAQLALTDSFLQLALKEQELTERSKSNNVLLSTLIHLFYRAGLKKPNCMSLFFKKDQVVFGSDFTLAMSVASTLISCPSPYQENTTYNFTSVLDFPPTIEPGKITLFGSSTSLSSTPYHQSDDHL